MWETSIERCIYSFVPMQFVYQLPECILRWIVNVLGAPDADLSPALLHSDPSLCISFAGAIVPVF
jgi:hypothetical protein